MYSLVFIFIGRAAGPRAATGRAGNATAELTGPWKFHIGDSPQANGRRGDPRWAQPDYDDSAWGAMDLTPPPGSYDPVIGSSGFVPGWTARGYKGYSGYAWYRLRVNVQDGQSALALKMPYLIDDAYQVYVNGRMVGEFGRFTARGVTAYENQPHAFSLPAAATSGPLTLAIRVWMDPSTLVQTPDAGGMHGPPILGQQAVVNEILQLDWDSIVRSMYGYFMVAMALLLAMLVACGLLVQDPTEPAFLWLAIATAGLLLWLLIIFSGQYTTWIDATVGGLLGGAVLGPISSGAWVVFWAYWFRLPRMGRIHGIVWSAVALSGLSSATVFAPLYGTVVPVRAVIWLLPLTDALTALLGVLVLAVAVYGIRKDRREGWIALPAALLMAFWQYWHFLADFLHIRPYFFLFGVFVNVGQLATILSLLVIMVLLLRRFLRAHREREQWKLEIEQARQVQQMLIPEALPVVPRFTLESEYRPAQQVGGDFFQILEGKDNSVLIVVGDVSGKGLKAAMLVSLIVGTIRTLAKFTRDPMEVLRGLNERLCGRMQGHFATCVVAHIAQNGETTIANAGHLAPYLNGNEVAIAGSLPLGIIEAAEFSRTDFQLCENDRLTFMTDGVVEAQNESRELFGFERTQRIGNQPAAVIAEAAQQFGQEDDITVVSVTRNAANVGAPGLASETWVSA